MVIPKVQAVTFAGSLRRYTPENIKTIWKTSQQLCVVVFIVLYAQYFRKHFDFSFLKSSYLQHMQFNAPCHMY